MVLLTDRGDLRGLPGNQALAKVIRASADERRSKARIVSFSVEVRREDVANFVIVDTSLHEYMLNAGRR